eukprot:EG_transcript_17355
MPGTHTSRFEFLCQWMTFTDSEDPKGFMDIPLMASEGCDAGPLDDDSETSPARRDGLLRRHRPAALAIPTAAPGPAGPRHSPVARQLLGPVSPAASGHQRARSVGRGPRRMGGSPPASMTPPGDSVRRTSGWRAVGTEVESGCPPGPHPGRAVAADPACRSDPLSGPTSPSSGSTTTSLGESLPPTPLSPLSRTKSVRFALPWEAPQAPDSPTASPPRTPLSPQGTPGIGEGAPSPLPRMYGGGVNLLRLQRASSGVSLSEQ